MPTVQVKLYATLRQYRPDAVQGQPVPVEVEDGATIADLLRKMGIPRGVTKQCFVNGLKQEPDYVLQEGDSVGVFPPIAGGEVSPAREAARLSTGHSCNSLLGEAPCPP